MMDLELKPESWYDIKDNKQVENFYTYMISNLPRLQMYLLYRSNNFWKAPSKFFCVSMLMTFVTDSFISSIVS